MKEVERQAHSRAAISTIGLLDVRPYEGDHLRDCTESPATSSEFGDEESGSGASMYAIRPGCDGRSLTDHTGRKSR